MSNNIEDIKIVEERIEILNKHISNYEEIDCKTEIYQELVKEKQALENIINAYKKIKLEYEQVQAYILANGIDENLKTAIQIKTENQAEYLCLGKIKRLEEQIEYLKSNSISKDKVKEVFNTKIYNTNYLAETDWTEHQREVDLRLAGLLKVILQELLEDR